MTSAILRATVFALAASACATLPPPVTPGKPAPVVAFALADGSELKSESTHGDVVVLAFFTKWCPVSPSMLRAIDALGGGEQPTTGLTLLAINEGDTPAEVVALAEKLGLRMRVAFDRGGVAATQLGLPTIPSIVVIDRAGVVRHVHGGYHGDEDGAAIASEVSTLLSTERMP